MSVFRRNRREETPAVDVSVDEVSEPAVDDAPAEEPLLSDRSAGPFDRAEVAGLDGRLDLGSLWLEVADGTELRLEVDHEQGLVTGATIVHGDSMAQIQPFAGPRSGGLWADIREEISRAIVAQGGTVQQQPGEYGVELATRVPAAGPDGRTVYAPTRFIGIDGPRWFLRAVLSGRAAIEEAAAAPLREVVRRAVVNRGEGPMAPRELLPMHLPDSVEGAIEVEPAEAGGHQISPFERGPEITEVR